MLNPTQYPTYFNQTFGQNSNNQTADIETLPQPMSGNMTEANMYPYESQYGTSTPQTPYTANYARGGRVKKKEKTNILPSLAEMVRREGGEEDSILAHINPLEAMLLKGMGGSGTINKKTGLPQFSIFTKPGKALKSVIGGTGGAILGNMILPGVGGMIGGALGQGLQHKGRGKSFMEGALKGGTIGAVLPSAAGLLGEGAKSMGMEGAGTFLEGYGSKNAILPSLGMGGSSEGSSGITRSLSGQASTTANPLTSQITGVSAGDDKSKNKSFIDKLTSNSKDFLASPANLLTLAAVGGSLASKPKEKSPEKKAEEEKRYHKAMRLTPVERAAREADALAERQMERRLEREKYLPEERFALRPIYRRTSGPDEYRKTGRWLNYYDNPEFTGAAVPMKRGGRVPSMVFEERHIKYPGGEGMFLEGYTKGQDDKIPASLSDGEYVIPADVVAHAGDGNSIAGGKQFDKFVKAIRRSKGGRATLPPKAKSLIHYMR